MTPFDQEKFNAELEAHFRRCGKSLQPGDGTFYFGELKRLPLSAIIKAIEAYELADKKQSFPATVADIRRTVSRLQREGEAEGGDSGWKQCQYIDDKGVQCGLESTVLINGRGWFCSAHFGMYRTPTYQPFPSGLVLLARRMMKQDVLAAKDMGPAMLKYLDEHPESETHPQWAQP